MPRSWRAGHTSSAPWRGSHRSPMRRTAPKGRTEPLGIAGILQQEREERINAVIDAGIQAIAERTLSSGRIHALATIPKLRSWPTDLEAKLRDAIARPLPKSLPKSTPAYVPGLLRRMPAWARPVVASLLASTRDRIDFLVRATPEDRVLALGKLDRSELIATLASPRTCRTVIGVYSSGPSSRRKEMTTSSVGSSRRTSIPTRRRWRLRSRACLRRLAGGGLVRSTWRHVVLERALPWLQARRTGASGLGEADLAVLPSGPLEERLLDAAHCEAPRNSTRRWADLYTRFAASSPSAAGWSPCTRRGRAWTRRSSSSRTSP